MVKRLRHRPFTAVTRVRFPLESYGLVAQLVRAPPCHGGGRRFESDLGRLDENPNDNFKMHVNAWDLSSAGRASALQAEGHRFEPCRSHFKSK